MKRWRKAVVVVVASSSVACAAGVDPVEEQQSGGVEESASTADTSVEGEPSPEASIGDCSGVVCGAMVFARFAACMATQADPSSCEQHLNDLENCAHPDECTVNFCEMNPPSLLCIEM